MPESPDDAVTSGVSGSEEPRRKVEEPRSDEPVIVSGDLEDEDLGEGWAWKSSDFGGGDRDDDRETYIPSLPILRYRGDLDRRYRSTGTVLALLVKLRGTADSDGILPSEILTEFARLEVKYEEHVRMSPEIYAPLLYREPRDVMLIINLLAVYGLIQETHVAGKPGRIRLTEEGEEQIEKVHVAAMSDPDLTSWLDMSDPVLSLIFAIEGAPEEKASDDDLPIDRRTKKKPSYRQWLWIMHNERVSFILAHAGLEVYDALMWREDSDEPKPELTRDQSASLRKIRKLWRDLKPFSRAVLTGGPEAVWVGKPLDPRSVHNDIESFYAARRVGYTEAIVSASSRAWEFFDANTTPMSEYARAREFVEMTNLERATVRADVEADKVAKDGYVRGIDSPALDLDTADLTEDEKKAIAEKSAMSVGEVEFEPTASGARVKKSMEHAGKLLMKTSADSLIETLGISEFRESGIHGGGLARVRCEYTRTRVGDGRLVYCGRWAIAGSTRCETHGGVYLDPDETRQLIRAGQTKIFAASSKAIDTIVYLMMESSNDAIRLRAAEQILNRAGLSENVDVNITMGGDEKKGERSAGDIVRERLLKLARVDEEEAEMLRLKEERDKARIEAENNTIDAEYTVNDSDDFEHHDTLDDSVVEGSDGALQDDV